MVVESFSVIKGTGTVQVLFETIPVWLSVLSPFHFKFMCFTQFLSIKELSSVSHVCKVLVDKHLTLWKSSNIFFKRDHVGPLNLVLISGSSSFINKIDPTSFDAPVIFTHEMKDKAKSMKNPFRCIKSRHYLNGGCSNARILIGFFGIQPPAHLTSVSRVLSDFLDYSIQPHQWIL